MALTTADQISIVISGGATNTDPNNSIGGDPSSTPLVSGVLNNLFDDVLPDQSTEGYTDYRCIYIFNDGDTTIFNMQVFILEDFVDGATIEIGVSEENEAQRITISGGVITDGSLTLSFQGVSFVTSYDPDLGVWASNLQDTLNSLVDISANPLLSTTVVTGKNLGPDVTIFDIVFAGNDARRNHPEFVLETNSLTPGGLEVTILTLQDGSPINTIAPSIGLETTTPGGVSFSAADSAAPLVFPKLNPTDGFPLWIKRIVAAGTAAKADDGVTLRIYAESLDPET